MWVVFIIKLFWQVLREAFPSWACRGFGPCFNPCSQHLGFQSSQLEPRFPVLCLPRNYCLVTAGILYASLFHVRSHLHRLFSFHSVLCPSLLLRLQNLLRCYYCFFSGCHRLATLHEHVKQIFRTYTSTLLKSLQPLCKQMPRNTRFYKNTFTRYG